MNPDFILVDGSSYLYRAFHALPPLTTSTGQPTNAIRGVVSMLRKMLKDYPDSTVVAIFDAKGKTFRHDMYAEYKANRPPMPDDLREQIEPLYEVIKAMGLPLIIEPKVEADDVIGSLAYQGSQAGKSVLVSTGDKDMAQLVNEHVTLVNTMSDTTLDVAGVKEKFGVAPEQIIDYLALMGDKVDNIPGVVKCGPKTAVKWLTQYETMQGVIDHADEVKGKIGENLRDALEQLPLSYELATIKTDLQFANFSIETLKQDVANKEQLHTLFKTLEFKTWLKDFDNFSGDSGSAKASVKSSEDKAAPVAPAEINYHTILTQQAFDEFLDQLNKAELFAFDTETNSLDVHAAELVGLSFSFKAGEAFYIPLAHDYLDSPDQLDLNMVLEKIKPALEDKNKKIVGQNLKYDQNVLVKYDITFGNIAFDTMLESYILNATATRHDMDSLAKYYLDVATTKYEDIAGKGKKQLTFNQVPLEIAAPYAAEDADITLRLHEHLWPQIEEQNLVELYKNIELPLLSVIADIEMQGVAIDAGLLQQQSFDLEQELQAIEKQAFELAGEEFNLASPKQLADILFSEEKLGLPVVKKTAKGAPSTAEEVLQELALDYPLPKALLNYRSLSKLKTTYTDKLPLMINDKTQRVHTSYHQAVVATGRLSSSNPNLQNIPIKTEEGRKIRQAFIAPKDGVILAADYSQVELRIMAHLSQDKGLLDAFNRGEDIHRATAAEIFNQAPEDVSSEMRRRAKAINFGLIYGMSAFGLAKQLQVGRNDAQEYMDVYFDRYPGVKKYMDDIRNKASADGYVETLFGRRLYLPEIFSKNKMRQQAALRAAINAPMQGTAADIIKKAMIDMHAYIKEQNNDVNMIMQVHDELVFEVPNNCLEQAQEKVIDIMSGAAELSVPLIVDVGIGQNWDEAH